MPHITVEYSSNLSHIKSSNILLQLNQVILASGLSASDLDIKSRLLEFDSFLIGTQVSQHAFVHVKVALLSGRSTEVRSELSENLLSVLIQADMSVLIQADIWPADLNTQLCVEIQDIERETYVKHSVTRK